MNVNQINFLKIKKSVAKEACFVVRYVKEVFIILKAYGMGHKPCRRQSPHTGNLSHLEVNNIPLVVLLVKKKKKKKYKFTI